MVKRIIYPPVWLGFGLISVFVLNEFVPGFQFAGPIFLVIGGIIIILGLVLLVLASTLFKRAETDLIPFKNVSALVTTGIYRLTRNPMYLGMTAVLLGCAITVGAATALTIPFIFMLIIEFRFIRHEEAMLADLFPEEFPVYCGQVRRWL